MSIIYERNKDLEKAIELVQAIIQISPSSKKFRQRLEDLLRLKEQKEKEDKARADALRSRKRSVD